MSAIISFIQTVFIGTLIIVGIGIFCYVQYPGFRAFCKKLVMNALMTVIICSLAMVLALIYIVSPIDLIPDPIPVAGQLDDLGVFASAVLTIPARLIYSIKILLADNKQEK